MAVNRWGGLGGMLTVSCGNCGKTLEVPPQLAGTKARCPCGNVIQLPTQVRALAPPTTPAPPAAASPAPNPKPATKPGPAPQPSPRPAAPTQAPAAAGAVVVRCPGCGAVHQVAASLAGTQAQCRCGQVVAIPAPTPAPSVGSQPAPQHPQPFAQQAFAPQQQVPQPAPQLLAVCCPSCGQAHQVPQQMAGTWARCGCGAALQIPGGVAPAALPGLQPLAPSSTPFGSSDLFAGLPPVAPVQPALPPRPKPAPPKKPKRPAKPKREREVNPYSSTHYDDRDDRRRSRGGDDGELTGGDVMLCLFCPGIACIVGGIRLISGNSSGGKMILFAFLWSFILRGIGSILGAIVAELP